MSPSKLKYTFKAATGKTIGKYRQEIRIERSEQLLRFSEWDISSIAEEMGFHSTSHFTTFFKRERGITPRKFRQLSRQNEEGSS